MEHLWFWVLGKRTGTATKTGFLFGKMLHANSNLGGKLPRPVWDTEDLRTDSCQNWKLCGPEAWKRGTGQLWVGGVLGGKDMHIQLQEGRAT